MIAAMVVVVAVLVAGTTAVVLIVAVALLAHEMCSQMVEQVGHWVVVVAPLVCRTLRSLPPQSRHQVPSFSCHLLLC